jgi:anti-sigma B factor antagonist
MEIEVSIIENIAHVKMRGRLDTHGVDLIETKFTASVVPGRRNTVVDLSGVDFITSMGLRMFIGIAKALKRHGAKMVLFSPRTQASEIFASAGLSTIVAIVADEDQALRSLTA